MRVFLNNDPVDPPAKSRALSRIITDLTLLDNPDSSRVQSLQHIDDTLNAATP